MADTKQKLPPIPTKSKRAAKNAAAEDPFATARVRAIIDPEQADLVTSKLDEIQTASGATVTIAAAAEGTIERIISVGGSPEVVGKGCLAVLSALNGDSPVKHEVKDEVEAEDSPSSTSLRVILPAAFASPLTRPNYPLLHQIHTESSATLTLNPSVLPLSTERLLVITAPSPQAISLAVQRISEYLQSSYEHYASIQNGAKPPVVYYVPLPVYGTLGAPENYDLPRVIEARMMTPQNPYGVNPKQPLVPQQAVAAAVAGGAVGGGAMAPQAGAAQAGAAQAGQVYQQGPTQVPGPTVGAQPHGIQPAVVGPGGQLTQQIFIPNDMVGAIIGKGGAKINEIRQMSGSHIKINEPAENSNERLVTITGTQDANQMALYLLYTRLETEKHRM